MAQSILVTGGAGYIGSHVCKALAKAGFLPVTLDSLVTGCREFVRFGPLVEACVSNTEAVKSAISQYQIHAVVDLAGSIEVAESVADPLKYYENNLVRKIHFLRALNESNINSYVFSSTAAVYGDKLYMPIFEYYTPNPQSPYGRSKLVFETILHDYFLSIEGTNFIILRYFNAAGASPDGDIGECHTPETHLIPRACHSALGLAPPLEIFGQYYNTPDGTTIRDYVHVMDLADAHVLAVKKLLSGAAGGTYNLGSGQGTSIKGILSCFEKLGHPVPHIFRAPRKGDPEKLVADVSRAKNELRWVPKTSKIEHIIQSAFKWHWQNSAIAIDSAR